MVAQVEIARATLIAADPLDGDPETWLAGADGEALTASALTTLNRVLEIQRIAAGDAAIPSLRRETCLLVRIGVGNGEDVADGRWRHARVLDPVAATSRDRSTLLQPQERLGAVLGARDVTLACELLTLRARTDADAGRWREAAFQLRVALEAALAELLPWSGRAAIAERIDELRQLRGSVGDAANAALQGGLDEPSIEAVGHAITRLEAALRARTQAELG